MATGLAQGSVLNLGTCELDLESGLVLRDGAAIPMRAKPLSVLRYLADHAGSVVGKTDIMNAVWKDVIVSDDSLTQAIRDIRVQIGDEVGAVLRTAARRGYMLVPRPALSAPAPQVNPSDTRTRIGILPFQNHSGSASNEYMATLLSDEVAAGLYRYKNVVVLSPRSVAIAANTEADPVRLSAALNADYLLFGTAQPAARGFQLALELIGRDGALIWADTFDCSGSASLDVPDAVPRRILGHIDASLMSDVLERIRYKPTSNLTAFDHLARGLSVLLRCDATRYPESKRELEAACAADPGFGLAYSYLARAELAAGGCFMASPEVKRRARDHAQRSVDLAPGEARAFSALGYTQLFVREFDAAERNISIAHRLNPSSVAIMQDLMDLHLSRGRPAVALDWLNQLIDASPVPVGIEDIYLFEILFHLGRFDEASDAIARLAHPDLRQRVFAAAIAAVRGDNAETHRQLTIVWEEAPDLDLLAMMGSGYLYEDVADMERLLAAVRLAMRIHNPAMPPI